MKNRSNKMSGFDYVCLAKNHRLSEIGWHCINKTTRMPIVVCYDCGTILPHSAVLALDLQDIVIKSKNNE